jgi:hypothetical protein
MRIRYQIHKHNASIIFQKTTSMSPTPATPTKALKIKLFKNNPFSTLKQPFFNIKTSLFDSQNKPFQKHSHSPHPRLSKKTP